MRRAAGDASHDAAVAAAVASGFGQALRADRLA
jgi:hypothetical protein